MWAPLKMETSIGRWWEKEKKTKQTDDENTSFLKKKKNTSFIYPSEKPLRWEYTIRNANLFTEILMTKGGILCEPF